MSDLELLIEKAHGGRLALLVGLDLHKDITGLPSGIELAHGLADKWRQPHSDSLAGVAQGLQRWKYAGGYLEGALTAEEKSGALHQAIARLPLPYLLTSAYDDCLACALEAAGRPAKLLVKDDDLMEGWEPRLDNPGLVKLCGDLGRGGTLVVTEDEHHSLRQDDERRKVLKLAGEWLREKTVLLLGCDPGEAGDFERWLYGVTLEWLGGFGAGGYLVWPNSAQSDVERWQSRGIGVIDSAPLDLLQSLADGLTGVEIVLPKSDRQVAFERFAQLLMGKPAVDKVETALAQLPPVQRPTTIRVSLR